MKKVIASTLVLGLLVGCASKQEPAVVETAQPTQVVEKTTPPPSGADTSGVGSGNVSNYSQSSQALHPLDDPNSPLAKRSVYYPFDVSVVPEGERPTVQAHAKYLSENPSQRVRLEGNCDERGSNEYNLALGQRRADGVKQMLMVGGAKESQLESISYGEEKPRASGHDEASWEQNRRTDINYAR